MVEWFGIRSGSAFELEGYFPLAISAFARIVDGMIEI